MPARLRIFQKVLEAGVALNLTSAELGSVELGGVQELTFYIVFGAGTSAGAVQIESSPITGYSGVWAPEGTAVAWAAASKVHKVSITGASAFSRARISTAIVGGSVDVWAVGNG